jgi:adenylate cyclase
VVVLRHLGGAALSRAGTVVTCRAARGRRLALLTILAAARGRPVSRDRIIALLWPEDPTDRARHQLSNTLYILRGALGDDVIQALGDDLILGDAVGSDVADFELAIEAAEWERAVELFGGPLLDGVYVTGSAEFERWLDGERRRLDQLYAMALERLANCGEEAGDFAGAVGWWRRLAAHDPHSGRVALGLMRSLEATGDRAGALRHARIHAELLQQEYDAQPDSDVVSFAERLRLTVPVPPSPPARPSPGTLPPSADDHVQQIPAEAPGPGIAAPAAPQRRRRTAMYSALSAALVLIIAGVVYGVSPLRPAGGRTEHSVAVLPFVNMSAESGADYFSDGLSEQIISALARIPGLRVAARTSSFALRDEKLDVRTIGDTLNVGTVLEGSVRRDGNRLRVTVQLIDARTGYHIWSADYDRELRQVIEVQDEIAREIARALELRLPVAAAPRHRRRTPDLQAYDLYLRALYLRDTFTPEALREAREYLDRATELDPGFASAHALKATVLGPAIYWRHVPREPALAEARDAVARALELDPASSDAHGALGMIKLFFDNDYPASERALRRALELNPNDNLSWHMLANYFSAMGRADDAVAARARGADIDPLNPRLGYMLGTVYTNAGRFPEALAQYQRMIRMQATHPLGLGLGPHPPAGPSLVYLKQGRNADVVDEYLRIATLRGATPRETEDLRASFADGGMPTFWRRWLEFDLRHAGSDPDPVRVATFSALAGDTARALEWLERAAAENNPALVYVFADPMFASVREHPRFRRIVRELNFPAN